jgi:hypothetical protein
MKERAFNMMISEGNHCFDEYCVEFNLTPSELEEKIKNKSDIVKFYK